MFDNLRQISDGSGTNEPEMFEVEERRVPAPRFFGMTAAQRFIIAIMLLATVVVLGLSCLLVTGKVWYF